MSCKVDWELGPSFTLERLSHWYHSLNITRRRGELVHHFFFVLIEQCKNEVIVTGGEDSKIQMWKDTPLNSSGFRNVNGDVEMMTAPEAYPLSCKNRKRNHDEDEILVRVLIDSITYISELDVRQERNCDTNDISIPKICMLSDLAGLVELDNSDTKHRRCLMHRRFCLASRRQKYGDDQTRTLCQL